MADCDSVAIDFPARERTKRRRQIASSNNTPSRAKRKKRTTSRERRESDGGTSVKERKELKTKKQDAGSGKVVKRAQSANRGQSQSCHQCRQSILSAKGMQEAKEGKKRAKCSTCTRFWCESCLLNRYGVSLEEAEQCKWSCPFCLKTCNCSLCRKKAGMLATGILTPLAKTSGFGSVSDYLTKSTDKIAACLQWAAQEGPGGSSPDVRREKQKQRRTSKTTVKRSTPRRPSSAPGRVQRVAKTAKPVQSPSSISAGPGRRQSLRLQSIPESAPITVRGGSGRWSLRPARQTAFSYTSPPHRRYDSVGNSSDESEQSDMAATVDVNGQTTNLQEKMTDSPNKEAQLSSNDSVINNSPSLSSSEGSDSDGEEEGWMRRQLELSTLKLKWKSQQKEQKEEDLRKARDERLHMQAQRKREREEEKERVREERRQLRVQERVLKQEELRRLLEEKKQQRISDRLTKEDELKKLKEKKREEKKRLQTALSVSLTSPKASSSLATEKEGTNTEHALPVLPVLAIPIQGNVEQLLQVLVFVNSFKDVLGIPGFQDIGALCHMLQTGAGLIELFTSLLSLVLPPDHHWRSLLQEDLAPISMGVCSKMVTECVTDAVRDKTASPLLLDFVPPKTAAARLCVLEFLFHEALGNEEIVRCIGTAVDIVRKKKADQRQWEQRRVKEISHQLMKMNDDKCSLEDLTQAREKCLEEVKEQKREAALSLWMARSSLRVTPLGKDRHGQLYWLLPHVVGVLVEGGGGEDVSQWYHVNTLDTFQELMASLNVMNDNELELLENLALMQGHITSSFVS